MNSDDTHSTGKSSPAREEPETPDALGSHNSQEKQPLIPPSFDDGRAPVSEAQFWNKYEVKYEDVTVRQHMKSTLSKVQCCPTTKAGVKKMARKRFPIASWLPKYNKDSFVADLIASVTIAVLNVPQGMSYGILAGLPPQYGLYTSIFPPLMYAFLGTSRQMSIGTFALVSLMSGQAATAIVGEGSIDGSSTNIKPEFIEASIAICFIVGLLQILMGFMRLSVVALFLSEALLSGYTCAAAFHIGTSQIKQFVGVSAPSYDGAAGMFRKWGWYLKEIPNWNPADIVCGLIAVLMLLGIREFNIRYKKKLFMPIPGELIVCGIAILASWLGGLDDAVGLSLLGDVPAGLPTPSVPSFSAGFSELFMQAIPIAIVGFVISISITKTFAKQHGYSTSASQELYAYGASALFGSFFQCFTPAGSLSRSAVANEIGMKTQIATLMQSGILMVVLLIATPAFAYLPNSVLGAVIIVALRGLILQVKDAKIYAQVKIADFYVWVISFVGTLIFNIQWGIVIALAANLAVIIIRTSRPSIQLLGWIPNTEIYRDTSRVTEAVDVKGVAIMRFNASIYYSNARYLMDHVIRVINEADRPIHSFVLDCNPVNDIDTAGVKMMVELQNELRRRHVMLYLAVCKGNVRDVLRRGGFYDHQENENVKYMFVTLHDAVVFACYDGIHGRESVVDHSNAVSPCHSSNPYGPSYNEEGKVSFRFTRDAAIAMLDGAAMNIGMMNAADSDTDEDDEEMYGVPLSRSDHAGVDYEDADVPNQMPYLARRNTYSMELPVVMPRTAHTRRSNSSGDVDPADRV
eukprot:Clim_evm5s231 gene=Clim_evmTU5s231